MTTTPTKAPPTVKPVTEPAPVPLRRLHPLRICPDQTRRTIEPLVPMLP